MTLRTRTDREDLTRQQDAVTAARAALAVALDTLADEATDAARVARSRAKRPGPVDLTAVHSARVAVERAETALDTAQYDLRTAAGEDG